MALTRFNPVPKAVGEDDNKQKILYVEDEETHYRMIHGPTHQNRMVSQDNFKSIRTIQSEFIKRAKDYEWELFDISNIKNIEDLIKK